MTDPALGPARRRISRIRWTTTIVFAATTAVCLGVLVVIALRVDTSAQTSAFDEGLRQQAGSLSELVSVDDAGTLDLGRLNATQVGRTTSVLGVVTPSSIEYAEPDQDALPADADLRRVIAAQQRDAGVTSFVAPQQRGRTLHWAVAPVFDTAKITSSTPVGAVLLVGGTVPGAAEHATLRDRLVLTSILLVLAASLLGHVVSGRAMRPAVRGLASQERFLVDAAHELRTPLSVLQLEVDRAAQHPDDPDAQRAAVDGARRQAQRLSALTDALLLRARAAVGTADLSREPLRLDQLVERVVAEVVGTAPGTPSDGPGPGDDAGAVLVRPDPPVAVVVSANADVLALGVRNLVENALRHGRPPVAVEVRGDGVVVTDAGPGIPAADRSRMVDAGTTGDTRAGTGSGLSIASWAARVNGGNLTLDDAPSGGLRATLHLPPGGTPPPSR
ncbi:sensor histidine kinase [Luteimicrobium sp. NPDC057192]|uniref:sensor histidine kinase n=1 Tax=Luteimicrobium sp. NPDC057192 TaxID=3346042 RepID=UPI00362BD119